MGKLLKSLLIFAAAFVVVDWVAFDGHYLAWTVQTALQWWQILTHLTWIPSR